MDDCLLRVSIYTWMRFFITVLVTQWVPEMNLMFVISATSANADRTFALMKDAIKAIVAEYGTAKVNYLTMVYGRLIGARVGSANKMPEEYVKYIDGISRATGGSRMDKGLEEAKIVFERILMKPNATNIVVVMTDSRSTGDDSNSKKINAGRDLDNMGFKVIPVGIGQAAEKTELEAITPYKGNIILTPSTKDPRQLANQIMRTMLIGLYRACSLLSFVVSKVEPFSRSAFK